jgi:hypothetical protein
MVQQLITQGPSGCDRVADFPPSQGYHNGTYSSNMVLMPGNSTSLNNSIQQLSHASAPVVKEALPKVDPDGVGFPFKTPELDQGSQLVVEVDSSERHRNLRSR